MRTQQYSSQYHRSKAETDAGSEPGCSWEQACRDPRATVCWKRGDGSVGKVGRPDLKGGLPG